MRPMNPSGSSDVLTILKSMYKVLVTNTSFGNAKSFDGAGNGTVFLQDNTDGVIVRVGSALNPLALPQHWVTNNTALLVAHNLGRRPIGYLVFVKTKTCDIYSGAAMVATFNTITLYNTDVTADTTLYIF